MVPNYTTNGINLHYGILEASKEHCGAVAVSLHNVEQCEKGIRKLINAGIKTNIHIVVRKSIMKDMEELLDSMDLEGLNAVIFLLHKPVGRALVQEQPTPSEAITFVKDVLLWKKPYKIGFDACFAPALVQAGVDPITYDYCDGGRFSGFVDWDMTMYPCSFAGHDKKNGLSLRDHSFKDIWNSDLFNNFRMQFKKRCDGCDKVSICGGGCPYFENIIPCDEKSKYERVA
jgi:radical SAM protein with 4Fe4S-binding SPASM domain